MKRLNMANYYSGLHQDCDHGEDFTTNYQLLTKSEGIFEMERILSSWRNFFKGGTLYKGILPKLIPFVQRN
jgi:hypothetical protein